MVLLPPPPAGRDGAVAWVREHLGHLSGDEVRPSALRGGQRAADAALAALDVSGYAARRSVVLPVAGRGATRLSPYIRHGMLPLPLVWASVASAPARDRTKFRDELLWQEYARHLYAQVGPRTGQPLRFGPPETGQEWSGPPWPVDMACVAATTTELHQDGWLVNQTRMWLASQWAVRAGADWRDGAQEMYRHLLDGSQAANRLGWQWTVGTATGRPYGFSRQQVEKRAPGLCATCPLRQACPIQTWPATRSGDAVGAVPGLRAGTDDAGPEVAQETGSPDAVWLTAESMGTTDPALLAHPDVPAVFVLDEPLLAGLRLSGKRLVFLAETLAELDVEVRLGDPVTELRGRSLAATWTPVPGWRRRAAALDVVCLHPWPWLRRPDGGSLSSFSAWRR